MYEEKSTLQSKTIIACLVNMGMLISSWFGFDLDQGIMTEFVMALISFGSVCVAIYGRITATKIIS